MNDTRLVLLAQYQTAMEAEMVRSTLGQGGVDAFVSNSATALALSIVGNAVGGTKVHVRECDLGFALKLLETEQPEPVLDSDWYCASCELAQDRGFDVCWKCGQDRATVGRILNLDLSETRANDPSETMDTREDMESIERDVSRAWRAAIFGIAILPFIFHLYSAFLLITVALDGRKLSSSSRRMFFGAATIDSVMFLIVYLILKLAT